MANAADEGLVVGYDTVGTDSMKWLDPLLESELDSESELEDQLTGVTDVFTNNDGALNDDDVTLARLFQYSLIKAGFDCKIAQGAEEGLQLIRSFEPDVIVSDIMMPNIDGFQFRRNILDDREISSIPFIFLTSKAFSKKRFNFNLSYKTSKWLLKYAFSSFSSP